MVHSKYIDPTTWELVTKINGVESSRTGNPIRILAHLKQFKELQGETH